MVRKLGAALMPVVLIGCATMGEVAEEALELNPEKRLTEALVRSPDNWTQDIQRAEQAHAQIKAKFGPRLIEHSPAQQRVQQVADRLAAVSHFKDVPAKVFLIEDDTLNAFTPGGGYIYVYTGLLDRAGSDDELAFVLGHELAHGMAEHSERQTLPTMTVTLGALLAATLTKGDSADQIIGIVHKYLTTGYSRRHEREADVLGTLYAMHAGYNPIRGADFFARAAATEQAALQQAEQTVRGAYEAYAVAYSQCDAWNKQYTAYRNTLYGPYYYQGAVAACNQSNAFAQQYNAIAKQYIQMAQGTSPLFRSHPIGEERVRTLHEVSAWMQGKQVRFSSTEAAYALRAVLAVEKSTQVVPGPAG